MADKKTEAELEKEERDACEAKDAKGNAIKKGDAILLPLEVTAVHLKQFRDPQTGDLVDGFEVNLARKTSGGREDHILTCNSKWVEKKA
jgi:uncharacterized Zn ribbon protein